MGHFTFNFTFKNKNNYKNLVIMSWILFFMGIIPIAAGIFVVYEIVKSVAISTFSMNELTYMAYLSNLVSGGPKAAYWAIYELASSNNMIIASIIGVIIVILAYYAFIMCPLEIGAAGYVIKSIDPLRKESASWMEPFRYLTQIIKERKLFHVVGSMYKYKLLTLMGYLALIVPGIYMHCKYIPLKAILFMDPGADIKNIYHIHEKSTAAETPEDGYSISEHSKKFTHTFIKEGWYIPIVYILSTLAFFLPVLFIARPFHIALQAVISIIALRPCVNEDSGAENGSDKHNTVKKQGSKSDNN